MKLANLIKTTRERYGETQVEFAKRFNTTANTISRWETGMYEVPNKVIELILSDSEKEVVCPRCQGRGKIWIPSLKDWLPDMRGYLR